jgi:hypothetical protein
MKLELMPLSHLSAECGRFCLARRKVDIDKWTKSRFACQSREIRTSGTRRMFSPRLITCDAGIMKRIEKGPGRKKF